MPRHSPVVFSLLLAATICVDAVVVFWSFAASLGHMEELYFGLLCGQISVVSIWAAFTQAPNLWRWLLPVSLPFAAALLTAWSYARRPRPWTDDDSMELILLYAGLWLGQVALIEAGLWCLRQTALVKRFQNSEVAPRWQFGVKHLLAAMTGLGVYIVIVRYGMIFDVIVPFVAWVCNNAILAVVAATLNILRWHALLQLALLAGLAILFTAAIHGIGEGPASPALNLIQVAVIFVWVQFGGLISPRLVPSADNASA